MTEPQKVEALLEAVAGGQSTRSAAVMVGLKPRTASKIGGRNLPDLDERANRTLSQIVPYIRQRMWWILEYIDERSIKKASMKEKSITFDILARNALLIEGRPTSISQVSHEDRQLMPRFFSLLRAEQVRRELERREGPHVTPIGCTEVFENKQLAESALISGV